MLSQCCCFQVLSVGGRLHSLSIKLKSSVTAAAAANAIATQLDSIMQDISFETVHLLRYTKSLAHGRTDVSDLDEKTLLNDLWFQEDGRILAVLLPPQPVTQQQQVGSKRMSADSASNGSSRYALVFNSNPSVDCRALRLQLPLLVPLPEGCDVTGPEQEEQLNKALFEQLELSGGKKWLSKEVLVTRIAEKREELQEERHSKYFNWKRVHIGAINDTERARAEVLKAIYEEADAAAKASDDELAIYFPSRHVDFYVHADAVDTVLE